MTELIIPNETVEIEYAVGATPSTGPFTIPFSFFADEDVRVSVNDGTDTTELTIVDDYSVAGVAVDGGYDGGSITLGVAVSNSTVRVYRSVVIDRTTNFPQSGPFDIGELNTELNKIIAICQELANLQGSYVSVPSSAVDGDPLNAGGRAIEGAGESGELDALATNRQVLASGPNWIENNNTEQGPLTADEWNTLLTALDVPIQGAVTSTTKIFDLLMQFMAQFQNRGGADAELYFRFRYTVDCYAEVDFTGNSAYRLVVPATGMVPVSLMLAAQDIDYWNGAGTVIVGIDVRPVGPDSANVWTQWRTLTVNTSEPR